MKRLLFVCGLLISSAGFLFCAADVSGLWTGTIDIRDEGSGTTISTPVRIEIDQQSSEISGKIGRPEDPEETPIKNAHLDGNKISFEAMSGETITPVKFNLVVNGDQMEGDMKTAIDTQTLNGKVKVTRKKK